MTKTDIRIDKRQIIVDRLLKSSFVFNQERGWVSMLATDGMYEIKPLDFTLYNGSAGVALALATLKDMKENKDILQEVLNYTHTYLSELRQGELPIPLGAFDGIYGVVYTLAVLNKEKALRDNDSKSIIIEIMEKTFGEIKQLEEIDIIRGYAGILGVLITVCILYKNDPSVTTSAKQIIDFIVNKMIETADRDFLWVANDLGYAHGNYGAMLQLCRYSQYFKISEAQHRQIADLLKRLGKLEKQKFMINGKFKIRKNSQYYSWCNGIAGLLMSKSYLLDLLKDKDTEAILNLEQLRREIDILYREVRDNGLDQDLSICHGNIGNAAILYNVDKQKERYEQLLNREIDRLLRQRKNMEIDDWGLMTGESGLLFASNQGLKNVWRLLLLEPIRSE